MNPILLIHGYSAESRRTSAKAITRIYGALPDALRARYGKRRVRELNVSRYVTLEDGLSLDDLARAMDQALRNDAADLLDGRFDVIIHSTGALVVRNWLRRFSSRPSPLDRLIYLAGAHFGSGWAHVGRGQLAKWGRLVFQGGTERGIQVLDALELGASETIDLHHSFLAPERDLYRRYRVREFAVIGSQVLNTWLPVPVRYAHEDGSDGVVRVAAGNPNWNYVALAPTARANRLAWDEITASCKLLGGDPGARRAEPDEYYRVTAQVLADDAEFPVPLAIPYQCAHSGKDHGVMAGKGVRNEVMALIDTALNVGTAAQYRRAAVEFAARREATRARVAEKLKPRVVRGLANDPRAQYDAHAQLVFRLRDQYGKPVKHFDIFFHSPPGCTLCINELFEHTHKNRRTDGSIVFYLRTTRFTDDEQDWVDQLARLDTVQLEIAPVEPRTGDIRYLPVCLTLSGNRLRRFVQSHRTTVIDVTLMRLPAPGVFRVMPAAI
ncbi:MAG: hypothetical protein JSV45_09015 [Chromatiales bacterium]|nr:MAG: hypothetical protein JSV45_09015 [Chromatiales bacterium]